MAQSKELWFKIDTPDRNTLVKLTQEKTIFTGNIYELTYYDEDDLINMANDDITLYMKDDPKRIQAELENQTLADFREEVIADNIENMDVLGEPVANDDNTFAAGYEFVSAGQCNSEIAELVNESINLNDETKQAILDFATRWDQFREEPFNDPSDDPEIEQAWDKLVRLARFTNTSKAEEFAKQDANEVYTSELN